MNGERRNQRRQPCRRCGEMVRAGEGFLHRVQVNGDWRTEVEHETCPVEGSTGSDSEMPKWAVYENPIGTASIGTRFVWGEVDANEVRRGNIVPVNDAAVRVQRRVESER